jgi:Uma2 family endonuclease
MRQLARDNAPERMSLADFLAWEEAQPLRHERVGGSVWAMTGGTVAHNTIVLNVAFALRQRLAGTPCRVFMAEMPVVTPRGDVMYPDVVVACGERRDTDKEVADPVVLVEVLSPSTAARDHGYKRWAYATILSLRHYVLISQEAAEAEVASPDGETWRSIVLRDATASLRLDALGLEIPLTEVFAGVDFAGESREASGG